MFQKRDTVKNNISEIYNIDYYHGKVYNNYFDEEAERKRRFEKKIRLINDFIPVTGRLLDVGCATGFFLEIMKITGYDTYGLDISTTACDYATNCSNLNIFNGDIFEAKFPDTFFDIITLWDVLEHMKEPEQILCEIYKIMKKKGILIIETLNINSWNFKLLKNRWPLYSPDYHLFYFNTRFLINLLKKIKFNVIKIIPIQTYILLNTRIRVIRYFDRPLLGKLFGYFFDDVILIIAGK